MEIIYPTFNVQYLKALSSHYCHFLANVVNRGVGGLGKKKSVYSHTYKSWKHLL